MTRNLNSEALDAKFEEFMRELSTDEESVRETLAKAGDASKPNLWWTKDKGPLQDRDTGLEAKPVRSWLKSAAAVTSEQQPTRSIVTSASPQKTSEPNLASEQSKDVDLPSLVEASVKQPISSVSEATEAVDYTEEFERTENQTLDETTLADTSDATLADDDYDEHHSSSSADSATIGDERQAYNATVVLNPSSILTMDDADKPSTPTGFGLETFVVQSGGSAVRGIQEILQEVEAVERSIKSNESESEASVVRRSRSESSKAVSVTTSATELNDIRQRGNARVERRSSVRSLVKKNEHVVPITSGLERELRNKLESQERLMSGYQKENERLYEEVKLLRAELKRTVDSDANAKSTALTTYGQRIDALVAENLALKTSVSARQLESNVDSSTSNEIGEIFILKRKILKLENEIKAQNMENKSTNDEMEFKTTRITSLEHQVKKLEELLRARHPDSISALVLASEVAAARRGGSGVRKSAPINHLLEQRIRELEAQLVVKNEDASRSLQVVNSRNAALMAKYKERIVSLERIVEGEGGGGHPAGRSASSTQRPMNSVAALEKELDNVRDRYRKDVAKLKNDVAVWQAKAKPKADDERAILTARIRSLVQETRAQQRQINELRGGGGGDTARPSVPPLDLAAAGVSARDAVAHANRIDGSDDSLRTEVLLLRISNLEENLRLATDRTSGVDLSNKKLKDDLLRYQKVVCELREENDRLVGKVFQLSRELETSALVVDQLRDEQRRNRSEQEHVVPLLRAKVSDLEEDGRQMRRKLADAELANETLERRHFVSLQERVREVESNYQQRCAELENLVAQQQRRMAAAVDNDCGDASQHQAELLHWKRKVQSRNREIERFRSELDSILRVLEELQTRGEL